MKLRIVNLSRILLLGLFCVSMLVGCVSHYFLESSSRLQVENATSSFTLLAVDVLSEDGKSYKSWISETVKPGERSHVAEEDWVGTFTLRFTFIKSEEGSKSIEDSEESFTDSKEFDLEGGSLFLKVSESGDSLVYSFK